MVFTLMPEQKNNKEMKYHLDSRKGDNFQLSIYREMEIQ